MSRPCELGLTASSPTASKHVATRAARLLLVCIALAACDGPPVPAPDGGPARDAGPPPGDGPLRVTVDVASRAGELASPYLGVTVDTAQLVGEPVSPGAHPDAARPDFDAPRLRTFLEQLAPSIVRVGGTMCDITWFCPQEAASDCAVPERYRDPGRDPERYQAEVLRASELAEVAAAARSLDFDVFWCLPFGPGPRDDAGAWTPEDAREVIRYARSLEGGERFVVWEAGNEVNGLDFNFRMPDGWGPSQYAADLRRMRALLDEVHPEGRLSAPQTYFFPDPVIADLGRFTARTLAEAPDVVDLLNWHLYATQSDRCAGEGAQPFPATYEALFDLEIEAMNRDFARYVRGVAGDTEIVLGELASAQCGGQNGLSDGMADALWMADFIGVMAEEGSSTFLRQSLVGFDYGLLEPDTYAPRPSAMLMLLFRRFVHRARLATTVNRRRLRAHAFCSPRSERAVTLVLAAFGEARSTTLDLGAAEAVDGRVHVLRSPDGPTGATATLDGVRVADDGTLPETEGVGLDALGSELVIDLAPGAVHFVELTLAAPPAECQ